MSVPGYEEFMLPLVRIASDGQEHSVGETMMTLAAQMQISAADQEALLPSGTQTRYHNRVSWAVSYLSKSLLLEKTGRGRFKIAPRGVDVLKSNHCFKHLWSLRDGYRGEGERRWRGLSVGGGSGGGETGVSY